MEAIYEKTDGGTIIPREEIIRCQDCTWYRIKGETTQYAFCAAWDNYTDPNWFCSRGLRTVSK